MDEVKWLIAREIPRLRRYALTLERDPDAADDLVQDTLERAIRKRHLWSRRGSVRSWLYRILYTVFLNKRPKRLREQGELCLNEHLPPSEPAQQDQRLICSNIVTALHQLPDDQRAPIGLTAVEGLSYEEAADVLGIPIGTLRSRLSRGREALRHLFVEQQEKPHLRRVK
ncbi:MAG: sigma-70 family RNA polymerase sigma factor [Rhodomicrobiaceae bacterium]